MVGGGIPYAMRVFAKFEALEQGQVKTNSELGELKNEVKGVRSDVTTMQRNVAVLSTRFDGLDTSGNTRSIIELRERVKSLETEMRMRSGDP